MPRVYSTCFLHQTPSVNPKQTYKKIDGSYLSFLGASSWADCEPLIQRKFISPAANLESHGAQYFAPAENIKKDNSIDRSTFLTDRLRWKNALKIYQEFDIRNQGYIDIHEAVNRIRELRAKKRPYKYLERLIYILEDLANCTSSRGVVEKPVAVHLIRRLIDDSGLADRIYGPLKGNSHSLHTQLFNANGYLEIPFYKGSYVPSGIRKQLKIFDKERSQIPTPIQNHLPLSNSFDMAKINHQTEISGKKKTNVDSIETQTEKEDFKKIVPKSPRPRRSKKVGRVKDNVVKFVDEKQNERSGKPDEENEEPNIWETPSHFILHVGEPPPAKAIDWENTLRMNTRELVNMPHDTTPSSHTSFDEFSQKDTRSRQTIKRGLHSWTPKMAFCQDSQPQPFRPQHEFNRPYVIRTHLFHTKPKTQTKLKGLPCFEGLCCVEDKVNPRISRHVYRGTQIKPKKEQFNNPLHISKSAAPNHLSPYGEFESGSKFCNRGYSEWRHHLRGTCISCRNQQSIINNA